MRTKTRAALVFGVAIVLAGCGANTPSPASAMASRATSAVPASPAPPSPAASARPASPGALEPDVPYYFDEPLHVTFSVPAGWTYQGTSPNAAFIANARQTAVVAWLVADNLYRDPCHWQTGVLDPPVGPGVDDLVAALRKLPGFKVTGPTSAMIGALPAQSLDLAQTVRGSGCDGSQIKVWSWEPTGNEFDLYGGTITARVLEVGGTRLVVFTWTSPLDPNAASDVAAITGSVRFR
jgi:hypothetical protein